MFAQHRPFLLILLLAAAIRIAFFLAVQPWEPEVLERTVLINDAAQYQAVAVRLLEGEPLGIEGAFRTPGYPLALAAVYSVAGINVWAAVLMQIGASLITLILLYVLTTDWFNRSAALIACAIYAFEPHAILMANRLMTDTLFTAVFLGALILFLKSLKSGKWSHFLWTGALFGIATLIRPITQYLPIVLVLFSVFALRANRTAVLTCCLALVLGFMTTIGPWLYRNSQEYGEIALSSVQGQMMYNVIVAHLKVEETGKSLDEVRQEHYRIEGDIIGDSEMNPFERSRIQSELAMEYIKEHPKEFIVASIRGPIYSFFNLDTAGLASFLGLEETKLPTSWFGSESFYGRILEFLRTKSAGELVLGAFVATFLFTNYVFALIGTGCAVKARNYLPVIVSAVFIAYFLAFIGPVGISRYKMPFVPLYVALAGYGISCLLAAGSFRKFWNADSLR